MTPHSFARPSAPSLLDNSAPVPRRAGTDVRAAPIAVRDHFKTVAV